MTEMPDFEQPVVGVRTDEVLSGHRFDSLELPVTSSHEAAFVATNLPDSVFLERPAPDTGASLVPSIELDPVRLRESLDRVEVRLRESLGRVKASTTNALTVRDGIGGCEGESACDMPPLTRREQDFLRELFQGFGRDPMISFDPERGRALRMWGATRLLLRENTNLANIVRAAVADDPVDPMDVVGGLPPELDGLFVSVQSNGFNFNVVPNGSPMPLAGGIWALPVMPEVFGIDLRKLTNGVAIKRTLPPYFDPIVLYKPGEQLQGDQFAQAIELMGRALATVWEINKGEHSLDMRVVERGASKHGERVTELQAPISTLLQGLSRRDWNLPVDEVFNHVDGGIGFKGHSRNALSHLSVDGNAIPVDRITVGELAMLIEKAHRRTVGAQLLEVEKSMIRYARSITKGIPDENVRRDAFMRALGALSPWPLQLVRNFERNSVLPIREIAGVAENAYRSPILAHCPRYPN